jgi:hypothetical protein
VSRNQQEKPAERQVRIEIDDTVADGFYANIAFIASNNSEFILDFARYLPGNTRGKVISRVVLGPINAKNFLKSLTEAVTAYEEKFGPISPDQVHKNIGFHVDQGK